MVTIPKWINDLTILRPWPGAMLKLAIKWKATNQRKLEYQATIRKHSLNFTDKCTFHGI